jgi:VIT1/CCC1 family predicted Fe2+/Mn2+ transporter
MAIYLTVGAIMALITAAIMSVNMKDHKDPVVMLLVGFIGFLTGALWIIILPVIIISYSIGWIASVAVTKK